MADRVINTETSIYGPLKSNSSLSQIRILDVDQIHDKDDEPISAKLRTVDLNTNPPFTALSYVWGPFADPAHVVQVGYESVPISHNGWHAICALRKALGCFTIWIDAICINQADADDKACQIPLMGQIYSTANTVYIWLGQGSDDQKLAMDYLQDAGFRREFLHAKANDYSVAEEISICHELADYTYKSRWKHRLRRLMRSGRDWLTGGINGRNLNELVISPDTNRPHDNNDITLSSLLTVLQNPWITRVWTLQEAAFSRNSVVVCDDRHLEWKSLVYAITFLEHSSNTAGFQIPERSWSAWHDLMFLSDRVRKTAQRPTALDGSGIAKEPQSSRDLEEYISFLEVIWRRWEKIHRTVLASVFVSLAGPFLAFIVGLGFIPKTPAVVVGYIFAFYSFFISIYILYLAVPARDFGDIFISQRRSGAHSTRKTDFIESIVQEIRSRECSVPLDKLFGILSIFQTTGLYTLSPDYTLSRTDVYSSLFLLFLNTRRSLSLLLLCDDPQDREQVSWLPSWTCSPGDNWILDDYIFDRVRDHATSSEVINDVRLIQWTVLSKDRLAVKGKCVGRISHVSEPFKRAEPIKTAIEGRVLGHLQDQLFLPHPEDQMEDIHVHNTTILFQLMNQASSIKSRLNLASPLFSEDDISIFFNVHSLSQPDNRQRRDYLLRLFRKWRANLLKNFAKPPTKTWKRIALCNDKSFSRSLEIEFDGTSRPGIHICNDLARKRRALMITDDARLGNVPQTSEVGDQLFLVWGVPMPLVLRPRNGSWQLVGAADVQGMMQSQLWKDVDVKDLAEIILH